MCVLETVRAAVNRGEPYRTELIDSLMHSTWSSVVLGALHNEKFHQIYAVFLDLLVHASGLHEFQFCPIKGL